MCSRKQELEKLENEKKAEKERLEAVERLARLNCQQQDDERRQKVLAKLEEIQKREIRENLKVHFIWSLIAFADVAVHGFNRYFTTSTITFSFYLSSLLFQR